MMKEGKLKLNYCPNVVSYSSSSKVSYTEFPPYGNPELWIFCNNKEYHMANLDQIILSGKYLKLEEE